MKTRKENKRRTKNIYAGSGQKANAGITLIALVVTIVILLILAAVSINLVLGNNGIMQKAQESGEATLRENARTEVAMMLQEYQISKVKDEDLAMTDFFETKKTNGDITEYATDDDDLKVEKDGWVATIDSNGEITNIERGSVEPVALPADLAIGDLVAYTPDANTTGYTLYSKYSGTDSNQTIAQDTTLTWRVMSINDDGTVDIVSTYPTSNTVTLYGAVGYNNGVYLLNQMCAELYGNSSLASKIEVRSINIEDFEKHLTDDALSTRNSKIGGTKTYTSNLNYPVLYVNEAGAGIDTTVDNSGIDLNSVDPFDTSNDLSTTSLGNKNPILNTTKLAMLNMAKSPIKLATTGFEQTAPTESGSATASSNLTVTETLYNMEINNTNFEDMGAFMIDYYQYDRYYWLASRYVNTDGDGAGFGIRNAGSALDSYDGLDYYYGMFRSNGNAHSRSYSLRPVVHLKSGVLTGKKNSSDAWTLKQ